MLCHPRRRNESSKGHLGLNLRFWNWPSLLVIAALFLTSGCFRASNIEDDGHGNPALLEDANPSSESPMCLPWRHVSDDALRTRLQMVTQSTTVLGYGPARDHMFGRKQPFIDVQNGEVSCLYTGRTTPIDGTRTPGNMNTEHTWPRSLGAKEEPALSDLHHLFVTDQLANNRRSNYPFGDTNCGSAGARACHWESGGSKLGLSPEGSLVFQVRPETRGDVARAQFYFAVRYGLNIPGETERALRAWHAQDPPDERELLRNEVIARVQGNRNPFVDCASLVERVRDF